MSKQDKQDKQSSKQNKQGKKGKKNNQPPPAPNAPDTQPVGIRQPTVMLTDLTGDLLWPRVLRAPALALAPSRLLIGATCAFLLSIVLTLAEQFSSETETTNSSIDQAGQQVSMSIASIRTSIESMNPELLAQSILRSTIAIRNLVMESPLVALLVGLPMIAILAVAGGAISRSTAIEFAKGRYAAREDTVGFALKRTAQLTGSIAGPIIGCVIVFLLIAVGGLLLSFPVFDVIGSIIYGLMLILGIGATIVLTLHMLALPMIIPALSIEGTDAFDAIQRSYAYVVAKPLRYLLYALLLTLVGTLGAGVFTLLVQSSVEMTDWAAQFFANNSTTRVLTGEDELGATQGLAHQIVGVWKTLAGLCISGYVISIFFASSSLLYLVARRICDGQDVNEVWDGIGE